MSPQMPNFLIWIPKCSHPSAFLCRKTHIKCTCAHIHTHTHMHLPEEGNEEVDKINWIDLQKWDLQEEINQMPRIGRSSEKSKQLKVDHTEDRLINYHNNKLSIKCQLVYRNLYINTHKHTHTNTHKHTHPNTHTHKHTHKHTNTHTTISFKITRTKYSDD